MTGRSGELDDLGSDHPGADKLIDYVRGELSRPLAGDVRVHAAGCMDCGDQLAALILLREEQLNTGAVGVRQAKVTPFPVPVKVPVRRWPLAGIAAAATLILALAWFAWPPSPGQPTAEDRYLVAETSRFLEPIFDSGIQSAAAGDLSDEVVIGLAVRELVNDDLQGARDRLEPFRQRERWNRIGTALLGYVLFLQQDPGARAVLEMYRAGHGTQSWDASADSPESLAFFFLARLRLTAGDDAGAREAVGWLHPRAGAGPAAAAWLQATLGDPARDPDSVDRQ